MRWLSLTVAALAAVLAVLAMYLSTGRDGRDTVTQELRSEVECLRVEVEEMKRLLASASPAARDTAVPPASRAAVQPEVHEEELPPEDVVRTWLLRLKLEDIRKQLGLTPEQQPGLEALRQKELARLGRLVAQLRAEQAGEARFREELSAFFDQLADAFVSLLTEDQRARVEPLLRTSLDKRKESLLDGVWVRRMKRIPFIPAAPAPTPGPEKLPEF